VRRLRGLVHHPTKQRVQSFSTRNNYTTVAPIDEAIADLESREAGDDLSLRGTAKNNTVYRIQH
jgi:hypothetical protein